MDAAWCPKLKFYVACLFETNQEQKLGQTDLEMDVGWLVLLLRYARNMSWKEIDLSSVDD